MNKTVLGIFDKRKDVELALDDLKHEGYDLKDISIVMKDQGDQEEISTDTGADIVEGTATGATTGAIIGGLTGLVASSAIPALGAFFIGGPIAGALGLTGAAASTVSGAATGALAGGLAGALMGWGLSEEEAKSYEESIQKGGILIAVPARGQDAGNIETILSDNGARDIKRVAPDAAEERLNNRSSDYQREQQSHYTYAGAKGGQSKSKGRGWHGDSKDHSLAGQGKDVPGRGAGK